MEKAPVASDAIKKYITRLEHNIVEFEKKVAELERNNKTLEQENNSLQEKLKLALYRQFGRHAEKFVGEGQPPLFDANESEVSGSERDSEATVAVAGHTRKQAGRKPLDEKIPRKDEIIDIAEEDQQCACGNPLTCIGEDVTERLVMIPEQVYVARYHVKKYACQACEGSGDEDKPAVRTGKVPANIIPGSIATPELLSNCV
jgi:transposase